jgi:cytochrome c-type biogenesis protein CcmI
VSEAVVVALALLLLAWVLVPLLRARDGARGAPSADAGEERKAAALEALVDLEEDRALGKLTPADYEGLRADYEAEALAALRELDEGMRRRDADEALEAEIAAARRELTCPRCGRARPEGRPCPECGT